VHEYEVTSWALYYERSTSHNFVVLHYIEPTASVFYTQNIWLHSHVLKCLLHALSEGKNKKFTPLRQYDVTGFIYAKTFFTIVISAPENPDLPLIAAQYLLSFELHIRQCLPKVPGTFSKNYENHSFLSISTITP